jgi:hypothetical protein
MHPAKQVAPMADKAKLAISKIIDSSQLYCDHVVTLPSVCRSHLAYF